MKKNFKMTAAATLSAMMAVSSFGIAPVMAEENPEVTIRVMLWDRGDAAPGTTIENNTETAWIQETMKEEYNINVEFVSVPRSTSDDVLNVMMSGGDAPDIVFTYDQSIFSQFAMLGGLADLTDAYEKYGQDIAENCGEDVEAMGVLDGQRFAIMKRRGLSVPRHVSYIRQDWLDQLEMDMPTTKEELFEYLYAVKENDMDGDGDAANEIPWGMSGRADTEKMYLTFLGSYVDLADDKDAYVYSEAYMAVAPGAIDGLRKLNELYNDGIIMQDFPTDTTEDVYKAQVAAGTIGFYNDDTTARFGEIEVLNKELGADTEAGFKETFVPLDCFELSDGSYRNPHEPQHGMFVMVPQASAEKGEEVVEACMKYLNWMAIPENAENTEFTPEHEKTEEGIPVWNTTEFNNEKGYKNTSADFNIVNQHFAYLDDPEAVVNYLYQGKESWNTKEWFQGLYDVYQIGNFTFPLLSTTCEAEADNGAAIKSMMIEYVYRCTCCSPDEFDSLQEQLYGDMVAGGLQDILDGRAELWDASQAE